VTIETVTTCYRHPDRETGRRCTRCGRPACPECLVAASVGSQCLDCLKAALPAPTQRLRRWNATHLRLMTMLLIAVNVGVYIYGISQPARRLGQAKVAVDLGLYGPLVRAGEWYRLVTSGFVHANLIHLGSNMLVIWIAGAQLEPVLGRVRFTLLYFAALLAGSAGALLISPDTLTIGASGAAFGLLGALAVGMRHRGIDIWRSGIGPLIAINLVITVAVPGISLGGHIGGLLGGLAAGWVLMQPRRPGMRAPITDVLAPIVVMALAVVVSVVAVS
jgi:membrane associated rhomboid family serine protease